MSENKACCGNNIPGKIREAICIDTNRVYDSCADKDCLAAPVDAILPCADYRTRSYNVLEEMRTLRQRRCS